MAKITLVYWSGTGNTESMALALQKGIEAGGAELDFINIETDSLDKDKMLASDIICFGSPACGVEQINEDYFEPLMDELGDKLSGKKLFLFGSFGHGDGEFMQTWSSQVKDFGATLVAEPILAQDAPEDDILDELTEAGKKLAS
ncbi:MAG: flavodoxin [Treponema sp.]|nr:MAG: flavodoxin [Treponema sp.]